MLVDVILQSRYVIGSKQVFACNSLYARCICNADGRDGIRGVNHKRARRLVNGKTAQRNERCGDLDRHDVTALRVLLVRTVDRDHQVSELAIKRIGIDIAIGRLVGGAIGLAVVLGTGKPVDLHEGAQLVLECDVTGAVGIVALDLGRETLARRNGTRDVLKDLIKLGGVGCRLVVAGTGNGVAKIDIPLLSSKKAIAYGRCGLRIVTRHGMHELILIARVVACWIVVRFRTVEDTDGINGRPTALYGLGGIDGVLSNLSLKTIRTRRRAVRKEYDDLLGVFTTRSDALGQVHANVGTRGTGGLDGFNRAPETLCAPILTGRELQHGLRVVIAVTIGIITDLIAPLTRKLYDGNLVLLVRILNILVLLGNSANKVAGSTLECIDALRGPFTAHGLIHRARGIEHENDIERLSDQRRCIGCRRHRRKRGQKVRFPVIDCLDRLVGPDSADMLGRYFIAAMASLPDFPAAAGIGVDDLSAHCRSVHSGAGPGVGLGQHGKCCSRQHQHYGQYHRQETPRVLTHRVSLLAGSDLASA